MRWTFVVGGALILAIVAAITLATITLKPEYGTVWFVRFVPGMDLRVASWDPQEYYTDRILCAEEAQRLNIRERRVPAHGISYCIRRHALIWR